jgi:hypothetical protein
MLSAAMGGQQAIVSELSRIAPEVARNADLERVIPIEYYNTNNEFLTSYFYNMVDLNDDGYLDAIVSIGGIKACSPSGNCPLLIFQNTGTGYRLLWESSLRYRTIIVTPQKTNGWNNILAFVKSKPSADSSSLLSALRELRFDGTTYPTNDDLLKLPKYTGKVVGVEYFSSDTLGKGISMPKR